MTTNQSWADSFVQWVAQHWLTLVGISWGLYVTLPFLAPLFMHWGWVTPARFIYAAYSYACHQLPDHSYFLFGDLLAPTAAQLGKLGMPVSQNLFEQRQFIGSIEAGYKVALCQRDIAIYGAIFLAGLVFAFFTRTHWQIGWRLFLLLALPMALDGGTQLLQWRESNWLLRSITGACFGAATIWFVYPIIDDAMQELYRPEKQSQSGVR